MDTAAQSPSHRHLHPRGCLADPLIGFPRESGAERRTILTPAVARRLIASGFGVLAERGVGAGVFVDDDAYAAVGVRFADRARVWAAPLVLRYKSPDPGDLKLLHPGQGIAALFHAEGEPHLLEALRSSRVTAWSYEFIAEDGGFPLARPGGQIAGIQAVLAGASALADPRGRGVLLAEVTGAPAAHVLVIGCGNVGAAAAHTAAALGAQVTVLTRNQASRARYLPSAPSGVRVLVNTPSALRACLREADLVIGAILVSTYDTPAMITEADLAVMRPGAVIVDATCGYGPGYLPTAGPTQRPGDAPLELGGILHVKIDVLPALTPVTTTAAYTTHAAPYLERLARVALLGHSDPAIDSGRIAHDGHLTHPVLTQHARIYGMQP